MLKSNFCDYNDAFIVVRGDITIIGCNVTQVAFKNYAPFTECIAKIDGRIIGDAEDLDWLCRCIICQNTAQIILT